MTAGYSIFLKSQFVLRKMGADLPVSCKGHVTMSYHVPFSKVFGRVQVPVFFDTLPQTSSWTPEPPHVCRGCDEALGPTVDVVLLCSASMMLSDMCRHV